MSDPILTRIEEAMESLIKTMRYPEYNYNWYTVNQPDLAKVTFPCATIKLDPQERNLDETNAAHAGCYYNEDLFIITVTGKLDTETDLPTFEINKIHNKALDDLKKIFGINNSIDDTADVILYRSAIRNIKRNGDIFVPGELITNWIVRYTQDRHNPTQIG